jgi:hypothetical protein
MRDILDLTPEEIERSLDLFEYILDDAFPVGNKEHDRDIETVKILLNQLRKEWL